MLCLIQLRFSAYLHPKNCELAALWCEPLLFPKLPLKLNS